MIKELEDFIAQIDEAFKDNKRVFDLDIVRTLPTISNENNELKFTEFYQEGLGTMYFLITGTNNLPSDFVSKLNEYFKVKVEAGIEYAVEGFKESVDP